MKKILISALVLSMAMLSCKEHDIPANPTVGFPIPSFKVTVGSNEYTVKPWGLSSDTLAINSAVRSETAIVKTLILEDADATINIKEGDKLSFEWDKYPITITSKGKTHTYCLLMNYSKTTPDVVYIVDKTGNFYVNPDTNQKLASINNNYKFEGYVDLSALDANDKIGLANSFVSRYYGADESFSSAMTASGTFVLQSALAEPSGRCPSPGPSNGNWTEGVGLWRIGYDANTNTLGMLNTVWGILGSATGHVDKPMTYDPASKSWSIPEIVLEKGSFDFVTTAIHHGDPILNYKAVGINTVSDDASGVSIEVPKTATYSVKLDLGNPGKYTYMLRDLNITPPKYPFMYVVWTGANDISSATPMIYEKTKSSGNYEGYVYIGEDGKNVAVVESDKSKMYSPDNLGMNNGVKYGAFTARETTSIDGLWGQWTQGNGLWRITFNAATKQMTAMLADWNICGTAVGASPLAMAYNKDKAKWSVTATLSEGTFKFATTSVDNNQGGSVDTILGDDGTGDKILSTDGSSITVPEVATYTVTLDMSNAPDYRYALVKEGEAPDPVDHMYFLASEPGGMEPKEAIYDLYGNGFYEGYICLKNFSGGPSCLISGNRSTYYTYNAWYLLPDYGWATLTLPIEGPYPSTWTSIACPAAVWNSGNGVWRISFDRETKEASWLKTDFTIAGDAVSGGAADMTYNAAEDKWTVTATLSTGSFKFVSKPAAPATTAPAMVGEKNVSLGVITGEYLSENGDAVTVAAGTYTITLDLSKGACKFKIEGDPSAGSSANVGLNDMNNENVAW